MSVSEILAMNGYKLSDDPTSTILHANGSVFECVEHADCIQPEFGGYTNRFCFQVSANARSGVCSCWWSGAQSGPGICSWTNNAEGVLVVFSCISVSILLVAFLYRYIRGAMRTKQKMNGNTRTRVGLALAQLVGQTVWTGAFVYSFVLDDYSSYMYHRVKGTAAISIGVGLTALGFYGTLIATASKLVEILRSDRSKSTGAMRHAKRMLWAVVMGLPAMLVAVLVFWPSSSSYSLSAGIAVVWEIGVAMGFLRASQLVQRRLRSIKPNAAEPRSDVNTTGSKGAGGAFKANRKLAAMARQVAMFILLSVVSLLLYVQVLPREHGILSPTYIYFIILLNLFLALATISIMESMLKDLSPLLPYCCSVLCRKAAQLSALATTKQARTNESSKPRSHQYDGESGESDFSSNMQSESSAWSSTMDA